MTPENVPYSSYRNGKLNTPEYLGLGCRVFESLSTNHRSAFY